MRQTVFWIVFGVVLLLWTAPGWTADSPPPEANNALEVTSKLDYKPAGRRDPFDSPLQMRKPKAAEKEGEPLTPLQTFGVNELRLLGAITGKGQPTAMVLAPDNKAYILHPGTKVGRHRGQVTAIYADRVVVEEKYVDFAGNERTETKTIAISQEEGE